MVAVALALRPGKGRDEVSAPLQRRVCGGIPLLFSSPNVKSPIGAIDASCRFTRPLKGLQKKREGGPAVSLPRVEGAVDLVRRT